MSPTTPQVLKYSCMYKGLKDIQVIIRKCGSIYPFGGAPVIRWMGAVTSPVNQPSAQMGSGVYPQGDIEKTANFTGMNVFDSQGKISDPDNVLYETDRPNCYELVNYGLLPGCGFSFLYGEPGGKCENVITPI
ncbi:hypothetical protein Sjap_020661 [Stephania japonica]|uniref:Neprosin PEP catalytic domain-containing protein n=1 Tax=Stephania japonica TaxID=461633 RepID=A0AAP0HZ70_9MAGN